jgi:type 1 glutamine amidotransferase
VDVVEEPAFLASDAIWEYDALVFHFMNWEQPDPGPRARANLLRYMERGGGLVLVHFACGAFQDWPAFAEVAGRVWDPNLRGHDPHGEFQVRIVDANHPVTAGLESFQTVDELYTCLAGDRPIRLLASSISKVDQREYPMAFSFNVGRGRVFHSPLGHDVRAFNPAVQALFRRGCAWVVGLQP